MESIRHSDKAITIIQHKSRFQEAEGEQARARISEGAETLNQMEANIAEVKIISSNCLSLTVAFRCAGYDLPYPALVDLLCFPDTSN